MVALAGGGQVVEEAAKPDKRHSMRNRNLAAVVAGTNLRTVGDTASTRHNWCVRGLGCSVALWI